MRGVAVRVRLGDLLLLLPFGVPVTGLSRERERDALAGFFDPVAVVVGV